METVKQTAIQLQIVLHFGIFPNLPNANKDFQSEAKDKRPSQKEKQNEEKISILFFLFTVCIKDHL